jgi:hypothetical protein
MAEEYVVREQDRVWMDFAPGAYVQLLRRCKISGTWSFLLKCDKGTVLPAHKHFGTGEYYMLKGKMEYGDGIVVEQGDYGHEAYGSVHISSYFHEESILFFSHAGSFAYLDENMNTIGVVEDTLDELEESLGKLGKWPVKS